MTPLHRRTGFARPFRSAVFLAAPLLVASCAPTTANFRYGWNVASATSSLPSPRMGIAVVVFEPPKGGGELDSLRGALARLLPSRLQEKGYDAAPLYSAVIAGSFKASYDGTRAYRSRLEEPVFAVAQAEGLASVFVLWINVSWDTPAKQVGVGVARGTTAVPFLSARLEMYSPSGEPLCLQEATAAGWMDASVSGLSYRVLGVAEMADQITRSILSHVPARSSQPPLSLH